VTAAASRKGKPDVRPASRSKTVVKRRPAPPVVQPRKKTMSDPKKPADAGADRNVDQIRDILFGGQMRDYERRFEDLGERLEAEMGRLREAQEKRIAQIDRRLDEQFEKLGKQLRQEIADRTQAVDDLESRVQQAARTARGEVSNAMSALEHELAATDERLRDAIAELASALDVRASEAGAAVARSSAELRAEKVGREDLSALMTELALRLKGDFELPSR
jgi:uncharacterized protein YukE